MKLLYRFVKWAFSRGTLPYWCIFAYDTLSVLVSGLFVYTLQYGVDNLYTNLNRVGLGIGLCMVLYMLAFFIFHTFNGVLRYSSFIDLRRVAYSSFTASIAICVFHQLQIRFGLSNYILVPRFVSGVQIFITATMLMWTARMAAKALHDLYNNFGISKNVFIYGAQSGAVALARSIVSDPSSRYKIKGFISDNEMMTSSRISGIKVYEDSPELVETMRKLHVQALLVSPLQTEHFTHDTKFIDGLIAAHKPEYVFHAAAYKHVPMMEDNPAMAIQNNVFGTRVIADLAVKYQTRKFVMISTDKAVNPTNVMGCSKRICEIYCQSLNKAIQDGEVKGVTQFVTTRFGNVLGSNGSVIPLFKEQIKKGGPVTVTHKDIIRYFMLIPEACRLVLEAGTMGHGGEIFVFDMGDPVRIADLAQRMIELSGAKNVKIEYTGLRDGEKLYEEVLNDAEQTKPTVHPKIKVAAVREYSYKLARKNEMDLYDLSLQYDDMEIVRKMKEIVPEYKSRHSKYEVLDKA